MLDMPYFMTNDDWYYFDGKKYVLTENAPKDAMDSLEQFYQDEDRIINNH